MKSKIFYVDRRVRSRYSMLSKLEILFKTKGFGDRIKKGDKVCVKTHFGAFGNTNYLRPVFARKLVDLIKDKKAYPVVAETCGLGYGLSGVYGGRSTSTEYLKMASAHGYTQESLGAPIVMLDGYFGTDVFYVDVNGGYIKKVAVGMALRDFDFVIVLSHFKGHAIGGIGGALKNLGIGCVGKYSKGMMHTDGNLEIDSEKCVGMRCGACQDVCPVRCITVDEIAKIEMDRCILCLHCSSMCRTKGHEAITVGWSPLDEQAKKLAENALGVLDGVGRDKFIFLNLALDISEACDCVSYGPPAMVPDLGIFLSKDPVAIDKACLDLANETSGIQNSASEGLKPGEDKFAHANAKMNEKTGERILSKTHITQLEHAERIGLGRRDYELVKVDEET